jgi:hypothetical protein
MNIALDILLALVVGIYLIRVGYLLQRRHERRAVAEAALRKFQEKRSKLA